jgi:hypothetical protein
VRAVFTVLAVILDEESHYFQCWLTKDHFSSSFLAEDFNAIFFLKISITGINQKKDKFSRKKRKKY